MSIYVDIRRRVGEFQLDVAFEAGRETLALLGDSGCGKSNAALHRGSAAPNEGVIRIDGETVFNSARRIDRRPSAAGWAICPELRPVSQYDSDGEHHDRPGTGAGPVPRPAPGGGGGVHPAAAPGRARAGYSAQLSGGQQQRVALARILASRPALLLLDEPFSALDATLRWEMEQVVRETIRTFEGTVVLVTHDRDEVYRLSDRVAVYQAAHRPLAEKWELFAHPVTATAARLTGCKNLFPGPAAGGQGAGPGLAAGVSGPGDRGVELGGHPGPPTSLAEGPGEYVFP